jgi:hypothetical protein
LVSASFPLAVVSFPYLPGIIAVRFQVVSNSVLLISIGVWPFPVSPL